MFYKNSSLFIVFCLLLFVLLCCCEFEPGGRPETFFISPGAESVIGASISVRSKGSGLFGCGDRTRDGVNMVDALRWATNRINNRLWSGNSPNISLGVQVMDSCSRSRTAASQLAEFIPRLKGDDEGDALFLPTPVHKKPLTIGLIDGVGFGADADVVSSLNDLHVPVMSLDLDVILPKDRVKAVINFMIESRWEHFTVVHSETDLSLSLLKFLIKSIKKKDYSPLCLTNVYNLESTNIDDIIESSLPVLVLLPSHEQQQFLQTLQQYKWKTNIKIPLLMSDLVLRQNLKYIPIDNIDLYAVITFPEVEVEFEEFRRKSPMFGRIHFDDDLELSQRSRTARTIRFILNKLSSGVVDMLNDLCEDNRVELCKNVQIPNKQESLWERLLSSNDGMEYQDGLYLGLVEYQFKSSDNHVHLHKIMTLNQYRNVDVFDSKIPPLPDTCSKNRTNPDCQCLQIKGDRSESSRHIGSIFKNKKVFSKNELEGEYVYYTPTVIEPVQHSKTHVSLYSPLRNPLTAFLAGMTLLGALLTVLVGQYFAVFAALPHGGFTTGTSILGYLILIGLFLLFSTTLSFLLTPSEVTCGVRRFLPSLSYSLVFSGMLIKVWTSWRHLKNEKKAPPKPTNLLIYALCVSSVQGFCSGIWFILSPPYVYSHSDHLSCYLTTEMDSHLLLSMTYVVVLLFSSAVLAIRVCSKSENSEARWILVSSGIVAILFFVWGVTIATNTLETQRAAIINVLSALCFLSCLYIPKMLLHTQLKRSIQSNVYQYPRLEFDKTYQPGFQQRPAATATAIPVTIEYATNQSDSSDRSDSTFSNPEFSIEAGTESVSLPFEIDNVSYSEPELEPFRFSTFLEEPQPIRPVGASSDTNDPTQMVPSTLYPLDMFNTEPEGSDIGEHCEPGTNEFTAPGVYLRTTDEWMP